MIFHVTTQTNWKKALELNFYEADSLLTEGFIHLSKQEQVAGVLDRYYQNERDLVLLHIDENKLTAPLKYELAPSVNEFFPHVFGRINIEAVVNITAIENH